MYKRSRCSTIQCTNAFRLDILSASGDNAVQSGQQGGTKQGFFCSNPVNWITGEVVASFREENVFSVFYLFHLSVSLFLFFSSALAESFVYFIFLNSLLQFLFLSLSFLSFFTLFLCHSSLHPPFLISLPLFLGGFRVSVVIISAEFPFNNQIFKDQHKFILKKSFIILIYTGFNCSRTIIFFTVGQGKKD